MQVAVTSADWAMETIRRGAKQRQKAATSLNYQSSRSHLVVTVCYAGLRQQSLTTVTCTMLTNK